MTTPSWAAMFQQKTRANGVQFPAVYIHADGTVANENHRVARASVLVGFQKEPGTHGIDLHTPAWLAGEPDAAVGLFPVFRTAGVWTARAEVEFARANSEGDA